MNTIRKTCVECSQKFDALSLASLYCGNKCRWRAHVRRGNKRRRLNQQAGK